MRLPPPEHAPATTTSTLPRSWPVLVAGALHLAVLPFFAAAGLLAPGWAVLLLVPPVALAVWWLALTAGEQLLGWTG